MTPQDQFKEKLIIKLKRHHPDWKDGDVGGRVDVVNHSLKVAIEIKDEPGGGPDMEKKTNRQYGDHLRSAYRKFIEYPGYKTALLIRGALATIPGIVKYNIEGIVVYGSHNVFLGRKNKYSPYIKKEIGCFLVFADNFYYFPNTYAETVRIIKKEGIEDIFGFKFQDVK